MKEYIPQILSSEVLIEKAKSLPKKPGIYLFFDKKGEIIYVGKSRALHDRVLSYFQNRGKHPPKTEKLVQTAVDFQTIVTSTEREALILENEKIKLHQPKFNIRLKDDKNYPYIRLSTDENYPRLSFARNRIKGDGKSLYFGPFSSSGAVRTNIDLANKLFSLPTCKRKFPQEMGKGRPCLFYHLGRCVGVCTGKVTEEDYARRIEEVILFFKHDHKKILSQLQGKMEDAAENMEFEKAAAFRDRIQALKTLSDTKQVVKDLHFYADVFGVFYDEVGGCIHLLSIREGRLVDSTPYHFGADEILSEESFASFVLSLYRGRDEVPKRILVPEGLFGPDLSAVAEFLPGAHDFYVPQRGEGRSLLEMANANAKEAALHRRAMMARDEEVLTSLASLLGLEVVPERIESIDISNSGASQVSAGIITVENARFLKRAYKSFSITTDHPDDTGCMYEAIIRRGKRYLDGDENFAPLPDLFLVDGAAGQVHAVKKAFSDLGLTVPVFGMVKDAFHKTRCLTDGENDISIAHDTRLFQFIYSIQEEVHRFSLSRMDSGRRKTVKQSSLTKIRGIGEKKATALLKTMKSIKAVRAASVDELANVPGISRKDAEEIYKAYHTKEKKDSFMMRIITGKAKGVRLTTLAGDSVRPTTEMTKEGVFSAIQFDLAEKSFLDLFAGSGQMGLEAISRGAASCTFVDCSEDSLKVLRKNIEKTGFTLQTKVIRSEYGEYIKSASKRGQSFDFVFADPPYDKDLTAELIKRILRGGLVKAGGLLMVEGAGAELDESKIPESVMETIESIKRYKFSKCYVYFVRTKKEAES